jgi:thioredoxin 1
MKNTVIVLLLVIAIGAVLVLKKNKPAGTACPAGICTLVAPGTNCVVQVATAPATKPLPQLLDLGAGKCIPCKAMAPILDDMREAFTGQFDVVFVDVWKDEAAAEQYAIRIIPTQIFLDAEGKELFRHEGFFARAEMLAKWKELGYAFEESP